MLKITVQKDASLITLKLEGKVAGEWVDELERAWLAQADGTKPVKVDLTGVTFVAEEGKRLLDWMFEQGSILYAEDCMNRSIIEQIRRKHHQHAADGLSHHPLTKLLMAGAIMFCSATGGLRGQEPSPLRLTLREAAQTADLERKKSAQDKMELTNQIAAVYRYNQSRADLVQAVGQIDQAVCQVRQLDHGD